MRLWKIFLPYLGSADDPLADISEVLNTDDDILGIISDDLAKSVDHSGIYKYCLPSVCFMIWVRSVCVWKFSLFSGTERKKIFFAIIKEIVILLIYLGFPALGGELAS